MSVNSRANFTTAAILFGLVSVYSGTAAARCDIIDVIEMIKDGENRNSIRKECESVVDDAPGCSLTKVMRYAKDRFNERQIARRCQSGSQAPAQTHQRSPAPQRSAPQIARFCTTPLGACPMMVAIPSGSRCHCAMPFGPVFGVAR